MTLVKKAVSIALVLSSIGVSFADTAPKRNTLFNYNEGLAVSINKYFNNKNEDLDINKEIESNKKTKIESTINYKQVTYKQRPFLDRVTYVERVEQMKKMQMLAKHISENNDLEIDKAERIINATFAEAEEHKIEPMVMLSVIAVESRYQQFAKSHMGAVGLVQVIPKYHRTKISALRDFNLDLWSIEGNIKVGTKILKEYIDLADGNVQRALQMYNGSSRDRSLSYSKKVYNQLAKLDKEVVLAKM